MIKSLNFFKKIITNEISKSKILILLLPYLVISIKDLKDFYITLIPSLIVLIFFDYILNTFKSRIFHFVINVILTYFFYSLIFYIDTSYVIQNLRFTYFSLIFIVISCVFFLLQFRSKDFKFFNTIIIVFCILHFLDFNNELSVNQIFKKYNLRSNHLFDTSLSESDSPVILLVIDGLSSGQEIYERTGNIKDLELDEFLKSKKYINKSKFKSESRWTQYSLSSLFNFNFHNNDSLNSIEKLESSDLFKKEFRFLVEKNLLIDSLNSKSVKSYSYGLTPFLKGEKTDNVIYMWGKEKFNFEIEFLKNYKFFQLFFHKSILNFIDQRFLNGTSYLYDNVRKECLLNLKNIDFKKNSFYFFHYFAPHSPFSYFEEYPLTNSKDEFSEHVKYRRFMISKLIDILSMEKFNDVRLIITGDHGFRSNNTDSYITQTALKGFDIKAIEKLRSVQDLGSLIVKSFN